MFALKKCCPYEDDHISENKSYFYGYPSSSLPHYLWNTAYFFIGMIPGSVYTEGPILGGNKVASRNSKGVSCYDELAELDNRIDEEENIFWQTQIIELCDKIRVKKIVLYN